MSRHHHPFQEVAYCTSWLKCMDIVESYHPDRVLSQFGRFQAIPPAPLAPISATWGATTAQYRIAYGYLDQILERWHNHLVSPLEWSTPTSHPWDCVLGDMDWYVVLSRPDGSEPSARSTCDPRVQDFRDSSSIDPQLLWLIRPIVSCLFYFNCNIIDHTFVTILVF